MLLSENFMISLRALRANKMRSMLTMLGIIIGVAAVVALLGIGNGATASITGEVQAMGSNVINVRPGKVQIGMNQAQSASVKYLYLKDYERLNVQLTDVAAMSPVYQSSYVVKYGNTGYSIPVSGVNQDYFEIRGYESSAGRLLTESDCALGSRVAALGSQAASDLFGNLNPIGKKIKVNGVSFEVIGVLKTKGSSDIGNPDNIIIIPLETGYSKLFGASAVNNGEKTVNAISISTANPDVVNNVMAQAQYILRRQHNLKPGEESDFSVMSQSDFLSTLSTITKTLTIFLGAIAAISLLVGGIGIMNIMLVSVTERTKEIGLRKAVGARKEQILIQFLIETLTLSVLGGVIGILFGIGIALLMTYTGMITSQVALSNILLAFFFSLMIGVFFGIYPAYRAANLHPIEALRYE
jgi:putative ABC transport system permease protein